MLFCLFLSRREKTRPRKYHKDGHGFRNGHMGPLLQNQVVVLGSVPGTQHHPGTQAWSSGGVSMVSSEWRTINVNLNIQDQKEHGPEEHPNKGKNQVVLPWQAIHTALLFPETSPGSGPERSTFQTQSRSFLVVAHHLRTSQTLQYTSA